MERHSADAVRNSTYNRIHEKQRPAGSDKGSL